MPSTSISVSVMVTMYEPGDVLAEAATVISTFRLAPHGWSNETLMLRVGRFGEEAGAAEPTTQLTPRPRSPGGVTSNVTVADSPGATWPRSGSKLDKVA